MAVGRQLEKRNCQDFLTILRYAQIIIRLWLNLRTTLGVAVGWGDRTMFPYFQSATCRTPPLSLIILPLVFQPIRRESSVRDGFSAFLLEDRHHLENPRQQCPG
jgi:hypothetical protein